MPGAPRVASASRSEPAPTGRRSWSKSQRLLQAFEFASFQQQGSAPGLLWRAARRWIVMNAIVYPPSMPVPSGADAMTAASLSIDTHTPMVRFGFTVSRRQARRAVVRNGVKRVLRESARHAATALAECASGRPVDILVRLKAPLPDPASASWGTVKRQIRREADSLIGQLREHLLASGPMSGRP